MRALPKPVFLAAGAYTTSLGSGRPEFDPRRPLPGLDHYIREAGRAALAQTSGAASIDEGVIGNFMAARFNRQGHLGSLLTIVDPALEGKPMVRVEGACASGGLALATAIKTVASGLADAVLVVGVEVQNTVKAVYGADILAGAGYYAGERKEGHAYFFPDRFSQRAGAYGRLVGAEKTHEAMARWYATAIENARRNPAAQEHTNRVANLVAQGLSLPDGRTFCDHINVYHCSKVSDGAAALCVASAEGLEKLAVARRDAVEIAGLGQASANLTTPPVDLTDLTASRAAIERARDMAGIGTTDLGVFEVHDCFSITGILSLEALGLAASGEGADLVLSGAHGRTGSHPTNTGGGLVGYGHPTGASGVRMAVDLWRQLTGKADTYQVSVRTDHAQMISMGGDDKTAVSLVLRR